MLIEQSVHGNDQLHVCFTSNIKDLQNYDRTRMLKLPAKPNRNEKLWLMDVFHFASLTALPLHCNAKHSFCHLATLTTQLFLHKNYKIMNLWIGWVMKDQRARAFNGEKEASISLPH